MDKLIFCFNVHFHSLIPTDDEAIEENLVPEGQVSAKTSDRPFRNMTHTISPVEEIMNAMAQREIRDPGAHLLALLRTKPESGMIQTPGVFSLGRVPLTVSSASTRRPQPVNLTGAQPRYDRPTLVACAQSPLALLMPPGLEEKFKIYPELKRKHHPGTMPGLRLEQLEAELLAPQGRNRPRPTAKICTWDPRAHNWVWQAPAFVVGH